ncbi:hypothetical protein, partial [Escherichia coli]|uniref:hypothetical protein n=1 Tax=Escherichia coli TaxID=562 RepID=UPI001BFE9DBD
MSVTSIRADEGDRAHTVLFDCDALARPLGMEGFNAYGESTRRDEWGSEGQPLRRSDGYIA